MSGADAFNDILEFIGGHGYPFDRWYAGITNDWERRRKEHRVEGGYIARICSSRNVAASVEAILLALGCKGRSGGGADADMIYAFFLHHVEERLGLVHLIYVFCLKVD